MGLCRSTRVRESGYLYKVKAGNTVYVEYFIPLLPDANYAHVKGVLWPPYIGAWTLPVDGCE